jgi:hypothetical protein
MSSSRDAVVQAIAFTPYHKSALMSDRRQRRLFDQYNLTDRSRTPPHDPGRYLDTN